jgi:predicted PurR-regulated permease PerM
MHLPAMIKNYIIEGMKNEGFVSSLQSNLQANISQIVSTGTSYATNLGSFAVNVVTKIFSTIVQGMILFLMAIFFSIEKEQVINFISSLGGSRKNHLYVKLQRMYAKL